MEPCELANSPSAYGDLVVKDGRGDIGRGHVAASLRSVIRVNDHRGAETYATSQPVINIWGREVVVTLNH